MIIYNEDNYSFASLETLANEFKKKELLDVFSKLTEDQQKFFLKLYPCGIDKLPSKKYDWAYQQIVRTIIKNRKILK